MAIARPQPRPGFQVQPMHHSNFAALILTHNRPNLIHTIPALRKSGYTGDIYLVVDDLDPSLDEYKAQYGEQVIVFSKQDAYESLDIDQYIPSRNLHGSVLYARNVVWRVAKQLGLDYFVELDDDYVEFLWVFDERLNYLTSRPKIRSLNALFDIMIDWYESAGLLVLCLAQTGDFLGGIKSGKVKYVSTMRKAMNVYIMSTHRPYKFYGVLNDDVNTYLQHGYLGGLSITITNAIIQQKRTQSQPGGLTTIYKAHGTYVKSFSSVLVRPSCTAIRLMGEREHRIHHAISWKYAAPVIIPERYRRATSKYQLPQPQTMDLPAEYLAEYQRQATEQTVKQTAKPITKPTTTQTTGA